MDHRITELAFKRNYVPWRTRWRGFQHIQWKQTSRLNRWGTMWFGHFDYYINNSLVHYPCVQKPTRKRMCRIRQVAPLASYCHDFLGTAECPVSSRDASAPQTKRRWKTTASAGRGARDTQRKKKENSCSCWQDSGVDEQDVRGDKPTSRCLPCRPGAKAKSPNPSVLLRFSCPSFSLAS